MRHANTYLYEDFAEQNPDLFVYETAEKFGLKKYFGSYEEMVKDDEINMVYIATINICHKEQAALCM